MVETLRRVDGKDTEDMQKTRQEFLHDLGWFLYTFHTISFDEVIL